jgi:hypothetical protein
LVFANTSITNAIRRRTGSELWGWDRLTDTIDSCPVYAAQIYKTPSARFTPSLSLAKPRILKLYLVARIGIPTPVGISRRSLSDQSTYQERDDDKKTFHRID